MWHRSSAVRRICVSLPMYHWIRLSFCPCHNPDTKKIRTNNLFSCLQRRMLCGKLNRPESWLFVASRVRLPNYHSYVLPVYCSSVRLHSILDCSSLSHMMGDRAQAKASIKKKGVASVASKQFFKDKICFLACYVHPFFNTSFSFSSIFHHIKQWGTIQDWVKTDWGTVHRQDIGPET